MSKLPEVCHDCEVPLGSIHEFGCDMEEMSDLSWSALSLRSSRRVLQLVLR